MSAFLMPEQAREPMKRVLSGEYIKRKLLKKLKKMLTDL
jgi:hypothetical protein